METETKEMTQEEVFLYLNNTKIICTSVEESTKVQEKLFELGIEWMVTSRRVITKTYLFYIVENKLQYSCDIESWMRNNKRRIEPNEILAIQLQRRKIKF